MKVVYAKINKVVTTSTNDVNVVNGELKESNNTIKTYKSKARFFEMVSTLDCVSGIISVNINGFIAKMEELGFNVEMNHDWGFEGEAEFYAEK